MASNDVADPVFTGFCQWLASSAGISAAPALAAFAISEMFLPGALDAAGNITPRVREGLDGSVYLTPPPQSWASSAPGIAIQALRFPNMAALQVAAANFGGVSAIAFAAARAAFGS